MNCEIGITFIVLAMTAVIVVRRAAANYCITAIIIEKNKEKLHSYSVNQLTFE